MTDIVTPRSSTELIHKRNTVVFFSCNSVPDALKIRHPICSANCLSPPPSRGAANLARNDHVIRGLFFGTYIRA